MKSHRKIWITWHYSARSRNLAVHLNIPLFELMIVKNSLARHVISSLWTLKVLIVNRPKIIFIQLSFLLLLICAIYKLFCFNKVVIIADCHTKALRRKAVGKLNIIFWSIKRFSFNKVNLSMISNVGMEKDIKILHENYLILPDKIPVVDVNRIKKENKIYCVYVSSFAVDEPFEEIFQAARLLDPDIFLYWTGKQINTKIRDMDIPENLKFTGYINFDEYYNIIANADCILALTKENDCLQSGAYEALSVGVPMVISDTKALREYFGISAIYTNHKPEYIAHNIKYAIENSEQLIMNEEKIKKIRNQEFQSQIVSLQKFIEQKTYIK